MAGDQEGPIDKLRREMKEKTPAQAMADDLTDPAEPTQDERENLHDKVQEKRDERA